MTSVLSNIFIPLDINAVRRGLSWAQSWSSGPVLCRIHRGKMQMIAVNEQQFLASWAWAMPNTDRSLFFLIPPFVAATIANPVAYDAEGLSIAVQKTAVGLIIHQQGQEFRLQWRWNPKSFQPPPHFSHMIDPPPDMMRRPYVAIADVVHLAIANLSHLADNDDMTFSDATIQMSLEQDVGALNYNFDPHVVIRGMEIARGDDVGFSLRQVTQDRALLYFTTQRDDCAIHCAMLSNPYDPATLPSTTLAIKETRPPMADGAWILPKRSAKTG